MTDRRKPKSPQERRREYARRVPANSLDNTVSASVPLSQMTAADRVATRTAAIEVQRNAQVAVRTSKEEQIARIREIEMDLLEKASLVVSDAMSFDTLPFDAIEPPPEWLDDGTTAEEAWERFRRIKAGQMKSADTPSGLKVASNVVGSVMRGKREEAPAPQLNVRVAVLTAPAPVYEEIPVEK